MTDRFVVKRRVLFGDCDPGGILYTPRAAHYIVEAGLDFFRARLGDGAERKLFEQGIAPPARAFSIEFLKPMTWDDVIEIEVQVKEIRTHAIVLRFFGTVSGFDVLSAEITQVIVSTNTMQPAPVADELRAKLLGNVNG
ncbi:MAG: thioesterase [Alcanivorax sp.]|nr:MAG: thioesterase [Alcanivorax sp.]